MAPSRREVGGGKKGSDEAVKQNSSTGDRTLPTAMSVRNLGQLPPCFGVAGNLGRAAELHSFQAWDKGESSESLDCQIIVVCGCCTGEKAWFRRQFQRAKKDGGECGPVSEFLFGWTPIHVVSSAYGCEPFRWRLVADMFPESGMQSKFLNEFYVMDVILNRQVAPWTTALGGGNTVCHAQLYAPEDEAPDADHQFRVVILFLPQCGVFYCSCDCHAGDAGLQGTFRAYDVSWLRLHRNKSEQCLPSYTFGEDGFVWRFYSDTKLRCGGRQVLAWRILPGQLLPDQQVRVSVPGKPRSGRGFARAPSGLHRWYGLSDSPFQLLRPRIL
jgi:hypothetical protein